MPPLSDRYRYWIVALIVLAGAGLLLVVFHEPVWDAAAAAYDLFSDRSRIQAFVEGFGAAAPLAFMSVQVFQVLLAPIPGEFTGFIGGYLFGTFAGFIYSSIALTLGSYINFLVGKALGRPFVERIIPPAQLDRFDRLFSPKGILVVFLLFIFPGFPKDYFCLFLGLTALPIRLLVLLAAVGRMPGTFLLSLQGASLYRGDYHLLAVAAVFSVALSLVAFRYRHRLYAWAERQSSIDESPR
jgi:uncharacterized membrane protein YdjX (TVP38/TMEM64 family)